MYRFVQALFWWVVRVLARQRYRVRVVGLERLRELSGPTLVMPNHPGIIDPPLVASHLRAIAGLRPIVTAVMYRNPVLYPMMRLVDALEVPDLREHSRDARQQTLAMIDKIVAGVERGESFLLYPAGRIQRRGVEEIGAARAAAEILERCSQANLVLVRTQGVWGSMFSCAQTGEVPDLPRCALRGLGWMIANLLLFAPRREVTITVEVIDRQQLPGLAREQLNPFLEEWYNTGNSATPVFVPLHFLFGKREFPFPDLTGTREMDLSTIEPETRDAVCEIIEQHRGQPLDDKWKQAETHLDDMGLDSLDRMDIALAIEDRFGFRSDRVADTLGELWALAAGQSAGADDGPPEAPKAWSRPPCEMGSTDILADTMTKALVRRFLKHPSDVVAADRISGVLTYRKLIVGMQLMGKRFGKLPGDAVGVLLPSSVAADLVFFALHHAGKLPVMLNWTTGPANLAHAVKTLGIQRVVTSKKVIDRLGIEVAGADYVFLEDVRSGIGKLEAVGTLIGSYILPRRLLRRLPRPDPDAPAVVLFTSGSESSPKAVPLSHRNLITNSQAALTVLNGSRADSMLGFLPPFHSFGVMGNVVAPLLSGIRVVHHPDPTDAAGLVRLVSAYRTTLVVTTPTFLSHMFSLAAPGDLSSLRVIITGAEKCPDAVFARAREMAPGATVVEGYGITECSPVVSGNLPDRVKPGSVGLPVDGVEVCVVHPDSKQPLPAHTIGLLLVRGPSVFQGYLNYDGPDPFIEVDGKQWYVTGDLVEIDDEGFLFFRGRLKRFLKVGGEMVSLPALEEPFTELHPPTENGPQVAVEGIETPGGRCIVLFTTQEMAVAQANALLAQAGFRGVMRIDDVIRMDEIPVLGTGKTDYKVLRTMVIERIEAKGK